MKMLEHAWFIEKMLNPQRIITRSFININFGESTTLSQFFCAVSLLIIAGTIYVEDASFGGFKCLVELLSNILTSL